MSTSALASEFLREAIVRMEDNTPRILTCLDLLSEAQVWQRPNAASNSVGNQILHLRGNIGQYILSSLAEQPDARERDVEFATEGGYSKAELGKILQDTVDQAVAILRSVSEPQLLKSRRVQAYEMSGLGAALHAVEHYSYHTGQIIFWTKYLLNQDLGFYAGVDLNQTPDP